MSATPQTTDPRTLAWRAWLRRLLQDDQQPQPQPKETTGKRAGSA